MQLCCESFERLVQNAGMNGFSVVAIQSGNLIGFFLQSRSYDSNQEDKLLNLPRVSDPPRPFVLVMQTGIRFCPYCGASLERVIRERRERVAALAVAHRPFAM